MRKRLSARRLLDPTRVPGRHRRGLPDQCYWACVTTLRRNDTLPVPYNGLSNLAYSNQCKLLEDEGIVDYPYAFYGNPDYLACQRLDCINFLRSFHTGPTPSTPREQPLPICGRRPPSRRPAAPYPHALPSLRRPG